MPAMKPPPIIRLKIANGNTITSASAPLLSAMTMAPSTSVKPTIAPIMNAYDWPIVGSQKNVDDQRLQNEGDRSAAAFNKTSTPDTNVKITARMFLPFETCPVTSRVGGGARTIWGLPQKGQYTEWSGMILPQYLQRIVGIGKTYRTCGPLAGTKTGGGMTAAAAGTSLPLRAPRFPESRNASNANPIARRSIPITSQTIQVIGGDGGGLGIPRIALAV